MLGAISGRARMLIDIAWASFEHDKLFDAAATFALAGKIARAENDDYASEMAETGQARTQRRIKMWKMKIKRQKGD